MPFFKDTYTLRRFGATEYVNGYPVDGCEDMKVVLDVQTVSDDKVLEEIGSRDRMILKTFGDFPIRTSKQDESVQSDQLFYDGRWFECISSKLSKNTFLKHYTSLFELILENPEGPPEETEKDNED